MMNEDTSICKQNYNHDNPKFSAPMPWIGIYVAAASLACSIAMAADTFLGFRHRKLWIRCKFFTLNAASLTVIAVAMKLPLDLSTPMPCPPDQLAKLSSTVLMCVFMGNLMPSIGPMSNKVIFMNLTALGILVLTMVVNVCIQLGTGVIYSLRAEQVIVMFFMLVLLLVLSFSSITVPTTKAYLEQRYSEIYERVSKEDSEESGKFTVEKLEEDIRKCWMLAESGSPQFVMARSVTCVASEAISLVSAVILAEAELRMCLGSQFSARGGSDYKWSTDLILVIQSIGVGVGTISAALRWFTAINFKCSKKGCKSYNYQFFKIENYWTQRLVEWKERPLSLQIGGRKCRKFVHNTKNQLLDFCIRIQIIIVFTSKLIRVISIFFVSQFLSCCHYCMGLMRKLKPKYDTSNNDKGSETKSDMMLHLSHYVLYLEGEEELPELTMKCNSDAMDHLIQMGMKQKPKHLIELLEKSTGFKGVAMFDNDQVPSLDSEEPPNCWTLPVVTLTSIAIALPNIENNMVDWLLRSVSEGLLYVSLVENNVNAKRDLKNIRNAANMVWLGVELYRKWLDKDLHRMALEGKSSGETLERLGDKAKNDVLKFKSNMNGNLKENPLNWPIKVIAANSMYRISQTILLDFKCRNSQPDERMFEQLSIMIGDILGACLTNLPRVITIKCFCSAIEKREESVPHAARLLGETEEILKILQQHELPSLDPDRAAYIDDWHALIKQKNHVASIPSCFQYNPGERLVNRSL